VAKFWLPSEDDLEQLSPIRLQMQKHEEAFEVVGREMLGVIDDQHDVFALLAFCE
jgi:hypothetical protein